MQDAEGAAQSADSARLRDVVARCAAMGSERPRAAYATRNLEQARPARLPLPAESDACTDVSRSDVACAIMLQTVVCLPSCWLNQ